MRTWHQSALLHIFLNFCIFIAFAPPKTFADVDHPKTNYDPSVYSQMITGYISDENLEVLPHGQLGLPTTMIILNEDELKNQTCEVNDPNSCNRTVRVSYPRRNYAEEDLDIEGQCQVINRNINPEIGLCKYDQRPFYRQDYIGADSSSTDSLPVPGWQSYNYVFSSNRCSGSPNTLTYGSHDNILPDVTQSQLKLSLLWRSFSTWFNYQKSNNVRQEMPVGGINWKEKVQVGNESIELITIFFKLAGAGMAPPTYRNIWQTELDPAELANSEEEDGEIVEEAFITGGGAPLPPVPKHLDDSTWFAKWNYYFKKARANGDEWVKYFDCTPLYPHDTNEPALAIGSLVIGEAFFGIPFNVALHSGTLVDNYASRQGTEGRIIETVFMYPKGQGDDILKAMGRKIPLVNNYFELSRTELIYTPSALVFGNQNTGENPDNDSPDNTVTRFVPLSVKKLGSLLDYPNQFYNPLTNPAPRMPKYLEADLSFQDAKAVYGQSTPTFVDVIYNSITKVFPHKKRTFIICSFWCQAERFLEEASTAVFATAKEQESSKPLSENPINVIPSKDGVLFPISDRTTHSLKDSFSRFMACKSDYRFDYQNTPRMLADGTAVNSCGQVGETSSNNSCSLDTSEPDAVESALEQAAAKASKATGIPASWLKAIYTIESGGTQLGANCTKNTSNAVGPMQIVDSTYEDVTCEEERVGINSLACERSEGKLSRCNLDDSMLLAARVLMLKLGEFPASCGSPAVSGITTERLYYAANDYYGICGPDPLTSGWNLPGVTRTPNYGDIACNFAGQSSTCNTLPQCR